MQTTLEQTTNQRYRNLIISIAVFLLLISALLFFTYIASQTLQRNTLLINTANQTANNAQTVIKDLFDLQNHYGEDPNSPHQKVIIARLKENVVTTPKLLDAMKNGGEITDPAGNTYALNALTSADALNNLQIAQKQWESLSPLVEVYLKNATNITYDSRSDLFLAAEQAKTASLQMTDAMNGLSQKVFRDAQNVSNTIRLVQLIGVAAILAYFVIFVFFFVRRLRQSDIQTDEARRETKEIMENVATGLFLLDKELKISQYHSKALMKIIGSEHLGGQSLIATLRGRVSDKDLNTTKQFIEQLYNPRVKEKLVDDLNPLKKVLVHDSGSSLAASRYLDFKFYRVYENKEIARILVNVSDVSEAVRLEQRLEKERHQTEMQIEMLTTVLNVEPSMIQNFILNTKNYIEKMNNILKNPGSTQSELENKINAIYREMHSLKGESSALKLQSFTSLASEAENILSNLRHQPRLTGNDFLPLTVQLDALLNLSNMIESLGQRIGTAFSTVDYSPLQHLGTEDDAEAFTHSHLEMLSDKNTLETSQPVQQTTVEKMTDDADTIATEIEAAQSAMVTPVQETATPAVADLPAESVNLVNVNAVEKVDTPVEVATAQSLEDLASVLFENEPQSTRNVASPVGETEVMATHTTTHIDSTASAVHQDTSTVNTTATVEPMIAPVMAKPVESVNTLQRYRQFVQDVAERQNKRVELDSSAYHEIQLPSPLDSAVREIVMQLLKNAVVHGIERNISRIADGKPAKGTITFAQEIVDDKLHLIVADDGHGIDYDKIRAKLVAMGKYDEETAQSLSPETLVDHLFDSGFSTKEVVCEDAGRGVGLDIIKARVEEHHGEINVQSELNKFTRFVIYIPI